MANAQAEQVDERLVNDPDGLLTRAEADLVERRVSVNGMSRSDAVASVKQERVGPAALLGRDDVPAAHIPGGDIPNPNPNAVTAEQRRAELVRQRDALNAQIESVDAEIAGHIDVPPPAPPAPFNTNTVDRDGDNELGDDDLRTATVEELIELVAEYPDLKDRVVALEREKGDGARITLLRALGEEESA